jgi:hypothetical protein
VFALLMTPPRIWSCLSKEALETMNFINYVFLGRKQRYLNPSTH